MNKKFTSLAVALMVAGTLSAETISIPKLETTEDYCYLKMKNLALSLHGSKADSVIMKAVDEENLTKAQLDSALWQIVDKQGDVDITDAASVLCPQFNGRTVRNDVFPAVTGDMIVHTGLQSL